MKLFDPIFKFLNRGHERSVRAKKNIAASFFLKGLNILIGLSLVPLSIHYLDQTKYGIWLTISSFTAWLVFFDVGLSNGLRNNLAKAFTNKDFSLAKKLVSTTYAIIVIIASSFLLIFLIINAFIPWHTVLNADPSKGDIYYYLAIIVFGSFSLRFVLKIITSILLADQKPAMRDLIDMIGKFFTLAFIFIISLYSEGSLILLGLGYSISPVIALLVFHLVLFRNKYQKISPSFKFIDFNYSKNLFGLGLKFFIIQIAATILFTTDNIIISQLFSPKEVTPYQVAHQYFRIISIGFMIIISPFWSAVTDAYARDDFKWIRSSVKNLQKIWLLVLITVIIFLIASDKVYEIWIGKEVQIPFILSVGWAIFVLIHSYNSIFVNFINGIGKLNLQILTAIFSILFNIPLSIILAKHAGMGITGVIAATNISIIFSLVLRRIQYVKIMNHKAKGIWNR